MIYLNQAAIHRENFPVTDLYPFNLEIFQNTGAIPFDRDITFFIGENGTGKSTLLKALAHRCRIHIWQQQTFSRIAPNPHEEDLYKALSVDWASGPVPGAYFGAQIFSHFTRSLEEWAVSDKNMLDYFGGASLLTQSHGQSLMSYFSSRYARKGLYLMDEPETALSPDSLIRLLNLLVTIRNQGHAQFIIATHSPLLLACPGARIYTFDRSAIVPVAYEDTDYFRLYKAFMNDPQSFIQEEKKPEEKETAGAGQ